MYAGSVLAAQWDWRTQGLLRLGLVELVGALHLGRTVLKCAPLPFLSL